MFTSDSATMSVLENPSIFTAFSSNTKDCTHLATVMFANLLFGSVLWVVRFSPTENFVVFLQFQMGNLFLLDGPAHNDQNRAQNEFLKHWQIQIFQKQQNLIQIQIINMIFFIIFFISLTSVLILKLEISQVQLMEASKTWQTLQEHYDQNVKNMHLRDLLQDQARNEKLQTQFQDLIFDYTHEKVTAEIVDKYFPELIENSNLREKLNGLFNGDHINFTQDRAVLHTCLRAPLNSAIHPSDNKLIGQVLKDVHGVLDGIQAFSKSIRSGQHRGASGKQLINLIVIGIGGSYLSIQFIYEALRSHPSYKKASQNRTIRFLANVDPIDFDRAVQGLNAEETLILVNSKTFTTAQTILNARSCRKWLLEGYKKLGNQETEDIIKKHICACSTNLEKTGQFGIAPQNVFGFWDFVGGRFSVWSAIGVLPLSIQFGFDVVKQFLAGGHSIDKNLIEQKQLKNNVPLLLGLLGFYRTTIQKYSARAIVPYCQALCKFAPHIQQLDMQSNGKRINSKGEQIKYETAVVNFGQPGTNGQHSFFQLLHQGRVIPIEFIGFTKSQQPFAVQGEPVSNHDELMSNFFSQPDALAQGKTREKLIEQKETQSLIPHKQFPGNRPTCSFLFVGELNAYKCGQLLALYEHRTSIQGFLFDVNSYDQFGVQLGKVLAKRVRNILKTGEVDSKQPKLNSATHKLLNQYLSNRN